jgi:hypothetical protein
VVSESSFTIPDGLPGYYSFTAQISLSGVGDVSGANDFMTTFLDLSGGSLTPINGTINIVTIVENTSNVVDVVVSGVIMQRLAVGDVIRLFHSESSDVGFTFTGGSIQVAYTYLGDTAL